MRYPFAAVCVLVCTAAVAADGPDWPQFRGPGALGVAEKDKPPIKLGPDTNVLWKVPAPSGMSSPVIAGNRIFLTAFDGSKLFTLAYDRATGQELWRKAVREIPLRFRLGHVPGGGRRQGDSRPGPEE